MSKLTITFSFAVMLLSFTSHCYGQLQFGFYKKKCFFDVESIVRGVVKSKFSRDPTIVAQLLRLQFHDCFVKGCDASILLDVDDSEKTALPNLSVRGYDIINDAKSAVELWCPGIVSCADIIVMATRDAVSLSKGGWYNVQTGRRDGFVSSAENVNLPSPSFTISQTVAAFEAKGLTPTDMVYLLGAHTVGITHCSLFQDRLYNFQNTSSPDPTMNTALLKTLQNRCPRNSDGSNTTFLDQNPASSFVVDNSYYRQIQLHNGILAVDQELALDSITKATVDTIAGDNYGFLVKFGQAMVKLGAVDVLTGSQGEIRKSCPAVNK